MSRQRAPASGFRLPAFGLAARSLPLILPVLWLLGALVTWNMVFDAHIVKGARDYVDAQQLFVEGRGPRQDMDRAMMDARSAGLRAAWLWTGVELAPLAIATVWFRSRRARASTTAASR